MTKPILECIPNYSEARRPDVVEAIMNSITSVEGVTLLDRHSDLDHNRTVLTFVGPPDAVEEAAYHSIATAAELINLENLRRGQYEALKREMGISPARSPYFGPNQVGPAGATVIGARQPLIAYNVYLTTDDVSIAEKIAKTIRFSSGGLRFVKALGLLVEGRAQISMNLTNYKKTSLPLVIETIRREASRYGVMIQHAELVGLNPQAALVDAAVWYLQLDQFTPDQILEQKLYSMLQAPGNPSAEQNEYGTDL